MWGKGGDWGSQQPIKLELDDKSYYRFRRIVRSWRKAKARSEYQAMIDELMRTGSVDTYHYVQRVSHIRGVNEFFDIDQSIRLVSYLKSLDYAQIEHL